MINKLVTFQSFYNVNKINFKKIDEEKLKDIFERSKIINKLFLYKFFKEYKINRYLRIMELINCNYREGHAVKNEYATTSIEEKFLLFMFSVDPNFEAAIIYGSEDRIKNAKSKIEEKLGLFDINLIKIENAVIKKLLSPELRDQIHKEIEKRAFK